MTSRAPTGSVAQWGYLRLERTKKKERGKESRKSCGDMAHPVPSLNGLICFRVEVQNLFWVTTRGCSAGGVRSRGVCSGGKHIERRASAQLVDGVRLGARTGGGGGDWTERVSSCGCGIRVGAVEVRRRRRRTTTTTVAPAISCCVSVVVGVLWATVAFVLALDGDDY